MAIEEEETTSVLLHERRVFRPSTAVVEAARVKDWEAELRAGQDIEAYWAAKARQFEWFAPWTQVLDAREAPFYKWFVGGRTNITHNAVDRHLATERRDRVALLYVNERGEERKVTYSELASEVNKMANALKKLGVRKGDRVAMYLPPCVEAAVSMLACAKIGAVHSVVYAGFSVRALADRIHDANAKILITADGTFRRGKVIDLKSVADEAVGASPSIKTTVVVRHAGNPVISEPIGGEILYDELIEGASTECAAEPMDAEDALFILYTSGSTGMPKGVVHTTAGYMVATATALQTVFDIHDDDVWWCTADVGWITGHSYCVYAPLLAGTTSLIYEGAPDYPEPDALWRVVERNAVTKFYTAPTTIRHLMRFGEKWPQGCDLSSLKILGTVGEPINPEAWIWYYEHVGGLRCPIMDTWWQTETGCFMISPLPVSALKARVGDEASPRHRSGCRGPGREARAARARRAARNNDAVAVDAPHAVQQPRTVQEDLLGADPGGDLRFRGHRTQRRRRLLLDTGAGRRRSEDRWAPHRHQRDRISVCEPPAVSEAAVIGKPDPIRGEVIKAFIILKEGYAETPELVNELKKHVRHELGPIAVIGEIVFTATLPKTRSGKIMRRVLKARELGIDEGDVSTLIET